MSDLVILAIISAVTTIFTVILNGWFTAKATKKRFSEVSEKVDKYGKDVNGNIKTLLETTKLLGAAEARAEDKKRKIKPRAK
jgi:uncharacterized protein YoxC